MNQAEDRVHRISQLNSVNVYYLYGPGTIDDMIFKMINQKSEVVSDSLNGEAVNHQITHVNRLLDHENILNPKMITQSGKDAVFANIMLQ